MSESERSLHDVVRDFKALLAWQKRLGAPGVPYEWIRERQKAKAAQSETPVQKESLLPPLAETRRVAEPADTSPKPAAPRPAKPVSAPAAKASTASGPPPLAPAKPTPELSALRAEIGDCTRCKLCSTRQTIVFGEGNPQAKIMFVGEGPGADEDASGRPFVGKAGQLLTKWIEGGMGLARGDVYIANIVKCRPPGNRDPEADEVAACKGFVEAQIKAVNPKVLVLLGRVPLSHLLGVKEGITRIHGTWLDYQGIPAIALFHPSYCLRPPLDDKRRLVWEDIKTILTFLDLPIPQKK